MIEMMIREHLPQMATSSRQRLARRVASIYGVLGCDPRTESTVLLTDDEEIRELNRTWRGMDESTDVLSFALQEAEDAALTPHVLGDVVISVETATHMATSGDHRRRVCEELDRAMDWGLDEELLFLAVHGVLHLLGHDHGTPEEEAEMRREERRVFFAVYDEVGQP